MESARDNSCEVQGAAQGIGPIVDHLGTMPTLLAFWAHPDDEAYLGAGLMAEVARRGARVVSVCATLGEHGTDDSDAFPPAELAEIRRRELTASLDRLGVGAPIILGLPDGGCDRLDDRLGVRRIATIVDDVRPDAVVSFGLDGVTGHPDHRALARWTAGAVGPRHDIALLTTAAGAAWPTDLVEGMARVGAFWPGYPERLESGPVLPVTLDGDVLAAKCAALAAHESQVGPVHDELGPAGFRRLASVESYRPANPAAAVLFGQVTELSAA
jgi:LmbE family N-acetylglucosaminyl deacetylase